MKVKVLRKVVIEAGETEFPVVPPWTYFDDVLNMYVKNRALLVLEMPKQNVIIPLDDIHTVVETLPSEGSTEG